MFLSMLRDVDTKFQQQSEVYNKHLMQLMFMTESGNSGSRSVVRETTAPSEHTVRKGGGYIGGSSKL